MSASATALPHDEILGHPKGLFVCFLTEMWERFAFYGMKALLFLYLTQHHLFDDAFGYLLLGTYAGLAYALPLVGGMLADKFLGMRKAVVFGGLLLVFGQFGMAYTGHAASGTVAAAARDGFAVQVMYASLALIAVGVGFLKPNISTIVGRLYPDRDPRRDSGFTIFYAGINMGAMLSGLIVGYIGLNKEWGWSWGFGISGALMLFGLVQFLYGQRHLQGHAEPPDPARLREPVLAGLSREWVIYLGALLATVAVWQVLQRKIDFGFLGDWLGGHEVTLTEVVAVALGVALLVWFFRFLFSGISAEQRGKMVVLMVLIVISALFWGLYEQTYGTWVAFTDRVMTKDLFPSFVVAGEQPLPWSILSLVVVPVAFVTAMNLRGSGSKLPQVLVVAAVVVVLVCLVRDLLIVPQTAGSLTFLGALFVVLLTPIFAWLWPLLDRKGLNPSAPAKFGWGLILAGASMAVLMYASGQPGAGGMVSVWWLVLAYFVLEVGEMVLSPIGLSVVTTLSVARVVGLMMGAWFLFSAFGEIIAGRFGTLAAMDPATPLPQAIEIYANTFRILMYIGVGAGVGMLVLSPILNRLSRGQDAPATPHVAAPEPDAR